VVAIGKEASKARSRFGDRAGRRDAYDIEAFGARVGGKRGFQKSRSA
jgi:hypothetical protein